MLPSNSPSVRSAPWCLQVTSVAKKLPSSSLKIATFFPMREKVLKRLPSNSDTFAIETRWAAGSNYWSLAIDGHGFFEGFEPNRDHF